MDPTRSEANAAAASSSPTESVSPGDPGERSATSVVAGDLVGGRYRVGSLLGRGGYATVHRAVDETSGESVALKVLRPDRVSRVAVRRLQREAESASEIRHPGLVRVLDHRVAVDLPFLVMELVEGGTLRERIAGGPLAIQDAVGIAHAVAGALQAIHDAGLVHRDLKPSNILLGKVGRVRLADLGLVTALDAEEETRATRADRLIGTMEYVSPEQALGHEVDARADLYSLGVVLFEMLAGRLPFAARSSLGAVLARVTSEPARLTDSRPDAPSWLVAIVRALLAREPAHRYPSARALAEDLAASRASIAAPRAASRREGAERRWSLFALTVTLVVAGAVGLDRWWTRAPVRLVSADVANGVLRAKDAQGAILWTHRFAVPLEAAKFAEPNPDQAGQRLLVRENGAGRPEVWIIAPDDREPLHRLFAFGEHGRLRFERAGGRPATFGGQVHERYNAQALYPARDSKGVSRLYLVSSHQPWFPSVIEQLDDEGRSLSQYWSNGHVTTLRAVRFGGRERLAVGAYNNETRGASLAILDLDRPTGRAPARDRRYLCTDCGDRDPALFLVLPPADVMQAATAGQGVAAPRTVDAADSGGLRVKVNSGNYDLGEQRPHLPLEAIFSLMPTPDSGALQVRSVQPGAGLLEAHELFFRSGQIDHSFGERDLRELRRVRRWDGKGFVDMPFAPAG